MKHVLVLTVFAAALFILGSRATVRSPYEYDEADYMHVARLGLTANFTDTPTMPIVEFFRTGLTRGRDAGQKSQLSELIRESDDVVFYRHWNGPLYIYWLMLTSHFVHEEHAIRLFTIAFALCSLLVIYCGCVWVFGGEPGRLAAMLSSALFVGSLPAMRSTELAPHQAFACCFLVCLMLLAKIVAVGKRSYFYAAVVAAALCCCLLEVGFVAVATVLVCGYQERRRLRADGAFAFRSVLLFVATALAAWPGALLKLSFLKGYAFMAYISLLRKNPWGQEGLWQTWEKRIFSSPLEWLIVAVGVVEWVSGRRPSINPFACVRALQENGSRANHLCVGNSLSK